MMHHTIIMRLISRAKKPMEDDEIQIIGRRSALNRFFLLTVRYIVCPKSGQ